MNRYILPVFLALIFWGAHSTAYAQDVPTDFCTPPLHSCIINEDYLTDSHSWVGAGATIEWLPTHSFGMVFVSSDAGVLKLSPSSASSQGDFQMRRDIDVPASQRYSMKIRFATDEPWIIGSGAYIRVNIIQESGTYTYTHWMGTGGREEFINRDLGGALYLYGVRFPIGANLDAGPSTISIQVVNLGSGRSFYLAGMGMGIVEESSLPLQPTPTVGPTLAVPTAQPPAANWCAQPANPSLSPGPTPTPNPARFQASLRDGRTNALWVTQGYTYSVGSLYNYPGSPLGAIALPRRASGTAFASSAIIAYQGITPIDPFYFAGYARNSSLSIGQSTNIIIWTTNDGSTWTRAYTISVGAATTWYPFSVSIAGGSVQAVAISAEHSGGTGEMYLDNLYAYGPSGYAPSCDQTVSEASTIVNQRWIEYPADKPCPPSTIIQPNNFWGPLLSELTLLLDNLFAFSPSHTPGSLSGPMGQIMDSQGWTYTHMLFSLMDFSPLFLAFSVMLGMEGFRALAMAWIWILRVLPFA